FIDSSKAATNPARAALNSTSHNSYCVYMRDTDVYPCVFLSYSPTATLLEHTSLCQGFMGTSKVVSLVAGDRKIVILRGQFWAMPSSVAVEIVTMQRYEG